MDTTPININNVWKDLTTDETLVADESYILQNVGSYIVYIVESSTTPNDNDVGIVLRQYDSAIIKQSTNTFYVRSDGNLSRIILNKSN